MGRVTRSESKYEFFVAGALLGCARETEVCRRRQRLGIKSCWEIHDIHPVPVLIKRHAKVNTSDGATKKRNKGGGEGLDER